MDDYENTCIKHNPKGFPTAKEFCLECVRQERDQLRELAKEADEMLRYAEDYDGITLRWCAQLEEWQAKRKALDPTTPKAE